MLLVDFFHLPQNNVALAIHRTAIQQRVLENISEDLHAHVDVFAE